MKRQKLLKKAKSAARTAICMLLCVASLAYLNTVPANATEGSYQGYLWTRMKNRTMFESFAHGAMTKSDATMNSGKEYDAGANNDFLTEAELMKRPSTDGSDWFRIMMIYDNDNYFISGNDSCNDNESFLGQRAKVSYGIDTTKDQFTTISGLNTPYIKYVKDDGDNNSRRYYIRFSENDELGSRYWTMHCDWHGIAYHAACTCDFDRPGKLVTKYVDNEDWWSFQTFQWVNGNEDGQVYVRYNIRNTTDRGWDIQGGGEIECTKNFESSRFKIYMGVKTEVIIVDVDAELPPGQSVNWADATIKTGATITVPAGTTLIIDGVCFNDGTIIVNGGTLVIRGVLDTHVTQYHKDVAQHCGSVKVYGGNLLVEEEGTWLTRNTYAGYVFSNNAHVDIEGIAVLAGSFTLTDSSLRVGYGAAFCGGAIPLDNVTQSAYTRAWIRNNKTRYLDSLCSDYGWVESNKKNGYVYLKGKSSLYSVGLFYLNPQNSIVADDASYYSVYRSSNIHANIESMICDW